jgi:hypothetical protein
MDELHEKAAARAASSRMRRGTGPRRRFPDCPYFCCGWAPGLSLLGFDGLWLCWSCWGAGVGLLAGAAGFCCSFAMVNSLCKVLKKTF